MQVNESVLTQPQLHSLLPLPGITAVPGDRFRELYYWDSYWVIKGLLVSNMTETATSEVSNLLSLLDTYGHVPNGARVYYINRRCELAHCIQEIGKGSFRFASNPFLKWKFAVPAGLYEEMCQVAQGYTHQVSILLTLSASCMR